jgi:repressor LexA
MTDDRQYLVRLQDYYAKYRVLPSYAGIGGLVGLKSKGSVAEMVARLKAQGYLESSPDRRLRPGTRFFERPVGEHVSAGQPSPVLDDVAEVLDIDAFLVRNPSRTVLVKVKGDSMAGAGILDGDRVVVERRAEANVGDIVVAIVDSEFTIKRLARERGHIVLRPENKAYRVIRPKGRLELFGVVVGLIRKYR